MTDALPYRQEVPLVDKNMNTLKWKILGTWSKSQMQLFEIALSNMQLIH